MSLSTVCISLIELECTLKSFLLSDKFYRSSLKLSATEWCFSFILELGMDGGSNTVDFLFCLRVVSYCCIGGGTTSEYELMNLSRGDRVVRFVSAFGRAVDFVSAWYLFLW